MFGFFKPNEPSVPVNDQVWMTQASKLEACRKMVQADASVLLVAWFEESYRKLQQALATEASLHLIMANDLSKDKVCNRMIVFVEHYPLRQTEQSLFLKLELEQVPVLSALDEPLFKQFGGERLQQLMRQIGMAEHEVISHAMVTKSIANAQRKLADTVKVERAAASQERWFEQNGKS